MQPFLLPRQFIMNPSSDRFDAPGGPLLQDLPNPHDSGHTGNENVEIAGKSIHQRSHAEEFLHQPVRIGATLQVDGQFQTAEIRLIPHVRDLLQLACLHQLGNLVHDRLRGRGIGNFPDLDDIVCLIIGPLGSDSKTAPSRPVDLLHLVALVDQFAAGGEVRRRKKIQQIAVRILQIGDLCLADFSQVEAAKVAGHANGNTLICGDQHIGKGGGEEGRLLHAAVIAVHQIHGVLVNIPEQLSAYRRKLCFRISGSGVGHIPGVHFSEVAFGIHKGSEECAIAFAQPDHGVVYRPVAMGIQLHGTADDIGGLGAGTREQSHLIHCIQQLAVSGFEAVDLRDRPGYDHAHGIGHVVDLKGLGDGLFRNFGPKTHDVIVSGGLVFRFCALFSCHPSALLSGNIDLVDITPAVFRDMVFSPLQIITL